MQWCCLDDHIAYADLYNWSFYSFKLSLSHCNFVFFCIGAKVKVECRRKATGETTSSFEGTTDHTGTYNILVDGEHEDEICESVLISSPESGCKATLQGREKAPLFLSHNNGIASATRYANALGFQKDTPLPVCAQLLKAYELDDEEENWVCRLVLLR